MTEEEAKTKWCPHVRFIDLHRNDDTASNRHGDGDLDYPERGNNPSYSRCIGSACMAWRWRISPQEIANNQGLGIAGHASFPTNADGYCGLAGKP